MLLSQKQDEGHKDGGGGEADEEHGKGIHPVSVGVSPKDGESSKGGCGDGDEQDADEFFHIIRSWNAGMREFCQPSHSMMAVEGNACGR